MATVIEDLSSSPSELLRIAKFSGFRDLSNTFMPSTFCWASSRGKNNKVLVMALRVGY